MHLKIISNSFFKQEAFNFKKNIHYLNLLQIEDFKRLWRIYKVKNE